MVLFDLFVGEVPDVAVGARAVDVVGEAVQIVVVQADHHAVLRDLDVGLDQLYAPQLHAFAVGRQRVGRQVVAALEVAAVGHDPDLAAVEVLAGVAEAFALDPEPPRELFGRAVRERDRGRDVVGAVGGVLMRDRGLRGVRPPGVAAVAEAPFDARHARNPVERRRDALHAGRVVVAEDDRHVGVGDRHPRRVGVERVVGALDDGHHRVDARFGVAVHGFALRRGGLVAEVPRRLRDSVGGLDAERHPVALGRSFGRPDDLGFAAGRHGPVGAGVSGLAARRTGREAEQQQKQCGFDGWYHDFRACVIIRWCIRGSGRALRG